MKNSILLTATTIALIGITFCGCGHHTNTVSSTETVYESTSVTTQSTEPYSEVDETTATVPTATQQESTAETKAHEETKGVTTDSTSCDYSQEEVTPATEPLCESTQPPYVSDYIYSDMELRVFELINQERTSVGLEPLKLSYVYADCAYTRALEADAVFSHTRPDGSNCFTVLNEYNLQDSYIFVGENLASGMQSAEQAMEGLMNSPSHRENILHPLYNAVSVSFVPMSEYSDYYVLAQIFIAEK